MRAETRYRIALIVESNPLLQLIGIITEDKHLEVKLKIKGVATEIYLKDYDKLGEYDLLDMIKKEVATL